MYSIYIYSAQIMKVKSKSLSECDIKYYFKGKCHYINETLWCWRESNYVQMCHPSES